MIAVLVLAHFVAGSVVLVAGRTLRRWIFAVAIAPVLGALITVATLVPGVLDGDVGFHRYRWIDGLSLAVTIRLDGFATVMALVVAGIGAAVLVYAWSYFSHDESPARVVRFAGFFTLFAGAMLGLVVAGDVWTLFVCWELTSVLSFVLIGLDDHLPSARIAAQRALLVTGAGGLVMLGGIVCLVHASGTADLEHLFAIAPTSATAQVGLVMILIGAFAKSAQVPFHFWLPGAMAAPTPVSAFLHSATMVKAGVVVVARFAPAFASIGWWRPLLVIVGGSTMLVGGVAALRRDDAKQSLAFGTVSQLGFLVVLFGIGEPAATAAGVAMLVAHALFKSGLFLAIGAVEHATGSRDLRRLSGVGRSLPHLAVAAGLCTLSMIGLPPLIGFVGKESALAALAEGERWSIVALVVVVVGSILTTAYSVRLFWAMFATKRSKVDQSENHFARIHHPPNVALTAPITVLALLSLAGGVAASPLGTRLSVAAESLDGAASAHLALWPGIHLPLLLSVLIVVAGAGLALVVLRTQWRPAPPTTRDSTLGERAYGRAYNGLLDGAKRITRVTQSGSLPVYVAVIFAVIVAAIGFALVRGAGGDWGDPVAADSVLQAAVALLAGVMAIAVVAARRRFVSVLLLGGVGQGLTVLFLLYGAPDLALTQFMIETLMIVAFVLVLRHLPTTYSSPPMWAPKALRIALSVAVGVTFAWFALSAGSGDRPTDVTDAVEHLSLPVAGGKNVVNVTIVDFRGVDTMGEITVFAVAALGVANLVTASRRGIGAPVSAATRFSRIGAQSMIFEQVTKMIFHITLLVSAYVALRGHNAPGGGFAGGLIAGAAFVFRLLAGDASNRQVATRLSPIVLIGTGMLLAIGTGFASLVAGNEFLETNVFDIHLPGVGRIHFPSAAIFDIGVYLLVIGVVIIVLSHLAARTHSAGADGAVT
ncbi:MAG: hydrogen gas-evolving membrane-bound hydrogenase subunit E [Ilumatobacteraceae bacterium]